MWTALAAIVLVASSPPTLSPAAVTAGDRIRLSAGPSVHVPGLCSGTKDRLTTQGAYERKDGLLEFARDDGSIEAVMAPGASVTGVLVGADPTFLHLRRTDMGSAERIHRASVARVEVFQGRKGRAGLGAVIGGVAGAALGLAAYHVLTGPTDDWPHVDQAAVGPTLYCGAMGLGAGAGLGALTRYDDWREVPLEALPGRGLEFPREARARRPAAREDRGPRARGWTVVGVEGGPGLAFAIVPTGEDREARPPRGE